MNVAIYYYFSDRVDIIKQGNLYEVYSADQHLLTTSSVLPTYEYCSKLIEDYYKDRNLLINKFGNENRDLIWKIIQFLERECIETNKEKVIRVILEGEEDGSN